jgi:hypothetical protein
MSFNIGLNVVEVDGLGAPAIQGAATSVGAFAIRTRRGPANVAVPVTSFTQFQDRFGGFDPEAQGAYLVQGFFLNGGRRAYITRVVGTDPDTADVAASVDLDDSRPAGAATTLTLRAGYRGADDPGAWGNDLRVRITPSAGAFTTRVRETNAAFVRSDAVAASVDMTAPPTLRVRVDGEPDPTEITFQPADFANPAQATRAEIAAAINKRTAKLEATVANNRLVLTSTGTVATQRRDWTSLQVVDAVAPLGFDAMANPQFGARAARQAGGTTLASVAGLTPGDALTLADAGGAHTATVVVATVDGATNRVTWTPDVADIAQFDAATTTFTVATFDLDVALGGTDDRDVKERWLGLSMQPSAAQYVERALNDATNGSKYLTAEDAGGAAGPGLNRPAPTDGFVALRDGRSGTAAARDYIGDEGARTGFFAFDPFDVQLVTSESTDPTVITAALGYCEARGDCMYVGAPPKALIGSDGAVAFGQRFQGKKVYGALYGPWISVFDPLSQASTPVRWVPPAGHVMGVYARTAIARGIHKAPAGDEARLLGALDVEYRLTEAEHTDLVKSGSINGIRVVPGAGIVVDASRTLSTDTRWLYVNVRLLFNYVKSSLKGGLRWVRQEPNRDSLWNSVTYGSVRPFLLGLWRQGAFGTGEPDDVFTIVCDASNNPPEEVDQGNFKVEVYFYPSKPAETIVIVVGQQPAGGSASEA